jgi:hypothetical protein
MTPTGLKPTPQHAPKRLATTADVMKLQRLMTRALITPLTAGDDLAPRWHDGRPMAEVVAEFIKPNARLTAVERLEIYSRSYWYRVIDCVYEDSPGLRALLGEKKFSALVRAYLTKYPSRSFTMRNLCARLGQFLGEAPRLTAPRTALAREIARFEWAQTVAFDSEARPVLTPAELAASPPSRLRLGLQPYLTLHAFAHPVDDYVIAVKQRETLRSEASNALTAATHGAANRKKIAPPRRERIWLAVHRLDNRLYYKRLEAPAFKILTALQSGRTLTQAVAVAGRRVTAEQVQRWFATWMELGWFCRR